MVSSYSQGHNEWGEGSEGSPFAPGASSGFGWKSPGKTIEEWLVTSFWWTALTCDSVIGDSALELAFDGQEQTVAKITAFVNQNCRRLMVRQEGTGSE